MAKRGPGNPYHDKLGRFASANEGLGAGVRAYRGLVKAKGAIVKGTLGVAHSLAVDFLSGGPTATAVTVGAGLYGMRQRSKAIRKEVDKVHAKEAKINRFHDAQVRRRKFQVVTKEDK